ncbi:hypothetical protein K501DRAFT_288835 [Backusella circina FSU 941]|nr:hypothetical protein K501DRAFT_288835 [Backusella circina FSU 941]
MTIEQEKKQKKQSVTKNPKLAEKKTAEGGGMVSDGLSFIKDDSSNMYPHSLLQLFAQHAASSSSSDYSQQLAAASSLAQVMVSPISLSNLPPGILQQLQQQQQGQQNETQSNTQSILNNIKENAATTTSLQQIDNNRMNDTDMKAETAENKDQLQEAQDNVNNSEAVAVKKGVMSSDEKRQKRLWRNRLAAKECRKKKKLYVHEIEEKVQMLEDENAKLHNTIKELTAKLEEPQQQQSAENYRLMKEVEELNAKLGMNS